MYEPVKFNSEHLTTAASDLIEAICDVTLGSITDVVIDSAVESLITSWNDHVDRFDGELRIDEAAELRIWKNREI